jgi:alkanal monooxygenase alpha chain
MSKIQPKMQWGAFLITPSLPEENHHDVLKNSIAYARGAEEMGYDDLWMLEHHFTGYGICGSPMTMAAFVLGNTRRIKVGTAVSVLPLEHPIRLAESVSLLDNMSNGRFMFGVGRGLFVKDFKVFGVDMEYNRERMEEGVDIILRAWRNDTVKGEGTFYNFNEVAVFPRVFTKPNPPIYAAVHSPSSIDWAARHGFPLLLSHFQDDEVRLAHVELYSQIAADHGYDPDSIDHAVSCLAGVGDTSEAVRAASRRRMRWWQSEFFRATDLFTPENIGMRGYEWYARRWEQEAISGRYPIEERVERDFSANPIGSVQECIDRLSRTAEVTGVKHFILGFESLEGGSGPVLESMRRFKEEVIPKIATPKKRFG